MADKGARIERVEIERFMGRWPCHELPDNLWSLWFGFASNGDLTDVRAWARNGRALDTATFDGPALVALSQDAAAKLR